MSDYGKKAVFFLRKKDKSGWPSNEKPRKFASEREANLAAKQMNARQSKFVYYVEKFWKEERNMDVNESGRGLGYGETGSKKRSMRRANKASTRKAAQDKDVKRLSRALKNKMKNGIDFDDESWGKFRSDLKRMKGEGVEMDESGRGLGFEKKYGWEKKNIRGTNRNQTFVGHGAKASVRMDKIKKMKAAKGRTLDPKDHNSLFRKIDKMGHDGPQWSDVGGHKRTAKNRRKLPESRMSDQQTRDMAVRILKYAKMKTGKGIKIQGKEFEKFLGFVKKADKMVSGNNMGKGRLPEARSMVLGKGQEMDVWDVINKNAKKGRPSMVATASSEAGAKKNLAYYEKKLPGKELIIKKRRATVFSGTF